MMGRNSSRRWVAAAACPARQHGAVAVMFIGAVLVMLAVCGLALDLARMYNRKIELQNAADAAALAAARKLDGTAAGISAAVAAASATIANDSHYAYYQKSVVWANGALSFATSADGGAGGWVDSDAARAAPERMMFAKVDTGSLAPEHGRVELVFLPVIAPDQTAALVRARAVAGRRSLNVTPFAVCANSTIAARSRAGELVEYGFRRGVSYDLMQLNPNGVSPENFLVNPVAAPGTTGASVVSNLALVAPHICAGTMDVPSLKGGSVTVERPFPLATLYAHLNARFGTYAAPCHPNGALPDANIKPYVYTGGASWMTDVPDGQTAQSSTAGGVLQTIADIEPSPANTTARMFGPLWAYARAVPYASFVPGQPEPAAGYATYSTAAWSSLYAPGVPKATGAYPSGSSATPYRATGGAYYQAPPSLYRSARDRRVLQIPLLACPVPSGAKASATVLAVARFFMTVPATSTSVPAEFAGLASDQLTGGRVELFK